MNQNTWQLPTKNHTDGNVAFFFSDLHMAITIGQIAPRVLDLYFWPVHIPTLFSFVNTNNNIHDQITWKNQFKRVVQWADNHMDMVTWTMQWVAFGVRGIRNSVLTWKRWIWFMRHTWLLRESHIISRPDLIVLMEHRSTIVVDRVHDTTTYPDVRDK